MPQGLLKVAGSIDLNQFWPQGESDADTTKILVRVGGNAFQFRPNATAAFQTTHAFDQAKVRGKVTKPCIDNKSRVTIRLQGIDAPELHYMPQAAKKKADQTKKQRERFLELNEKYRQKLGETATVELSSFLQQAGQDPLSCHGRHCGRSPKRCVRYVWESWGKYSGDDRGSRNKHQQLARGAGMGVSHVLYIHV